MVEIGGAYPDIGFDFVQAVVDDFDLFDRRFATAPWRGGDITPAALVYADPLVMECKNVEMERIERIPTDLWEKRLAEPAQIAPARLP
jgi:hypothetical protein